MRELWLDSRVPNSQPDSLSLCDLQGTSKVPLMSSACLTSEFWPLLYSSGNASSVSAETSLSRIPKMMGGREVKKRLKNIICQ